MVRSIVLSVVLLSACRVEFATPGGQAAVSPTAGPSGEVWVYTSMYRNVIDALEPTLKTQLPNVTVHWFQAGSEKVAAKLEAELAAGGTPCDLLITSDPFLYQRFKKEGRWLRYVSPNGVRTPARYVDPDGHYAAIRLSTMVLVHRKDSTPPASFAALVEPAFKGEVALGDPLTSGTAFTWAVSMEQRLGEDFFTQLRANGARVAGGNAAVLQKVEGQEAKVGVLLLENALAAKRKGSPIEIAWPSDGAVVIPGYAGIMASTQHAAASQALLDALLSPAAQQIIAAQGDMHAVDPRTPPPGGVVTLDELLTKTAPWDEALLERGLSDGARVKSAFSKAFAQ
ncbi:MAG: extracellular solute-binding protein [Myxococcaceae bacterium]